MAVVTAYQIVKDYVRNQSRISAADSGNADGSLVGSRADETAGGESGQSGSNGARLDREDGDGNVSGSRPGGETGTDDMAPHDGERGDRGVGGRKSDKGDVRSGSDGTVHGDKVRGGRRNGRKPAGHGNSGSVSDSNEGGSTQAGRTEDSADDIISSAFGEITDILTHPMRLPRDRFYDATSLVAALGVNAIKLFGATAKLGYGLVLKGFHNYKKWASNMHTYLDDLFKQHTKLTDEQMDEFIKSMWDYPFAYKGEVHTVGEWASILEQEKLRELMQMSIEEKRKLQKAAEGTETITGDIDNIRESLPFLLPAQQEDVQKAEVQFFDKSHSDAAHGNGKGYMFTNGTGTGKTYTGLGIVKRFLKQGKGRVLIVTAQEKKINDWIRDAKNLGIEATMLQDTKSKGKGVVVTQYANIRQNYELLKDEFDLIVYDESHKLMENQTGEMTTTATFHHMLANRDVEQAVRRGMQGSELWMKERKMKEAIAHLQELLKEANKEPKGEMLKEIKSHGGVEGIEYEIESIDKQIKLVQKQQEEEVKKAIADPKKREAAQKAVDRTKVVFLSATPFNTASSLDYAESYIFSYPAEDQNTDRDKRKNTFIMDRFPSSHARDSKGGVRRLDEVSISDPESASKEEIAFSDFLQNDLNTMSGRMLDSTYDYSREFPLVDIPEVKLFNKAVQELQNGKYAILKPYFDNIFKNYPEMTAIFEAIKTAGTIQRIKEHIALGRKVVIFHRRMNAKEALEPPFAKGLNNAINHGDATEKKAAAMFMSEYRGLLMWEQKLDLSFPHEQITNAFATKEDRARYQKELEEWRVKAEKAKNAGKKIPTRPKLRATSVGCFNGTETQSVKEKAVNDFNDDNSPVNIVVVQIQSGKEGIDLHDTTGGHQRVVMSLQLPQSPIEFIQAEGRIYRVGNKSNAIFEYPLLGIDLELASFSMKINGRSQTSENLALGSKARGLRDSIARAALASRPIPVEEGQGVGGKKLDDRSLQEATDYDTSVTNYAEWANEDKEKDFDKMQTPDPIGFKMMEWAGMTNGETLLVPNAGTGTIARYVPTSVKLTALEGDMGRYAKLVTLIGGGGRKVEPDLFKDFHISNKADCVVMNGEHSTYKDGLSDANHDVENLMKASRHLEQGGRIVAVVDAKNAEEIENALKNSSRGALVVSAEIKLPAAAFDGHKATVMVIDRVDNETLRKAMPPKAVTDLSGAKTKEELFEQLRDVKAPARVIDKVGKVKKRVERVAKRLEKCSLIRKTKMWKETVKNLYLRDTEISIAFSPNTIAMPIPGYGPNNLYRNFELNYEKIADDNFDYIQEAAQLWMYLDELTKMDDSGLHRRLYCPEKKMPEVRDTAETLKQCVAAALNKTEMQIKNIARGEMENKVSGVLSFEQFKEAFKSLNSENAGLEALGKKVFDTVEKIEGMRFSVVTTNEMSGHNVVAHYVPSKNIIELNGDYFNSMRMKDEFKASTIVHEMIHAVTCYAVSAYEHGHADRLTQAQIEACKDILAVYDAIDNNEFRSALRLNSKMEDNAEYGLTNVYEMLAEMSNPIFRAQLKAKKLWRQLVNGIKRLLGMDVTQEKDSETSALDVLENALDTLLNEFNPELYKDYTNGVYNNEAFNREAGEEDVRFRTSEELDEEYPEWLSGQTTGTGQHTTQITSTVNTYRKIGEWIGNNMPEGTTILDASSGLGKGTEALREMGFEVDDVEPYPSNTRTEPTYRQYDEIEKKYDVVISNAVLNVIPDNWRRDVLHSMADKVNEGGRMIINVRDAKEMERQKQKIELDSPSEILVTDKKGNIRAYQKGFTQKELTEWIKNELGEGWQVETANARNSGITGRAVVVTRTDGDISRETETFGEGQQIAIEQTEEGLRVDGLGNEYADTFSLLDAWRNKYPNYFTSLSEDGKTLVVTSWDLKPRKQTAAESRRAKAYLKRKTENARRAVTDMAKRLHLENVEILESTEGLEGKKAKAKGWTDTRTGKIVIVLPNHTSVGDVLSTLLHEGVAHFGLRKLFGKHFDTFLDNVYKNASEEVRKRIAMLAARKKWNIRVATEEYLATMAEDMNFERAYEQGWWSKIKDVFLRMLAKVGVSVPTLTDNELRYILWRSYDNLKSPGHRSIFSAAEDIATQSGLGVGNYAAPVASADRVADSASEEQQIIDKAKADGTYMKAPNGKKSNLTPKQWAQVRTKAFKEWFGDWEKVLRIEKLRSSNPIEITGDEYKGKYELDRESAKGWIKDNLRDEYRIDDTDELIQLTKVGANKVTSHSMGNDAHLKSIAVIPDIIKNAIFIEERVNEKGNDKFDSYRYYACGLRIGETDYTVKLTIGVKSGRKYYDHALTEIEKGKLLNVISQSGFKAMGDAPVPSSAILKDTKLISILQANSSKVVDENGEPRVVYHGSDWGPILDGDGIFKAFDGAAGKGVYFTSVFSEAADYAREKLDNDELTEDEIDEGHYVTEVFLNITDSDDIYSSDYGTDGLNYLVKNPSQIKSATDNNGEFDSNNPDIRFREADESDISDRDGVLARDFYEKMVSTGLYQVQEALQDSMLGLKKFYEAVYEAQGKKFRMEDVAGFENAYMAENALSSINMAEMNAYRELVFNPILEEVAKIAKTKEERRELEDYMIAKHGLERNVVFARRDAQKAFEKQEKKRKALEKLGLEMKKQKSEEDFFNEFRKKDYSGLTDLMEATAVAEAEELAAGQHRKVFRIDVADGDELHVGYFHRPSLQLMAAASKVAKSDEVRSGETLFDGCFLGGSEVMRFPQCDAGT